MKALLLTAALLLAQADAGVSQMRVKIVVRAIAASNDPAAPAGMDPKLKPIAPSIESFGEEFRFRSYKLIEEHSFDLDWKNAAQVELPGSRSLQVTPRQLDSDGRIKVHLELLGEYLMQCKGLCKPRRQVCRVVAREQRDGNHARRAARLPPARPP